MVFNQRASIFKRGAVRLPKDCPMRRLVTAGDERRARSCSFDNMLLFAYRSFTSFHQVQSKTGSLLRQNCCPMTSTYHCAGKRRGSGNNFTSERTFRPYHGHEHSDQMRPAGVPNFTAPAPPHGKGLSRRTRMSSPTPPPPPSPRPPPPPPPAPPAAPSAHGRHTNFIEQVPAAMLTARIRRRTSNTLRWFPA